MEGTQRGGGSKISAKGQWVRNGVGMEAAAEACGAALQELLEAKAL